MRYVGIDVSRDKLDCAVVDESGHVVRRARSVANTAAGAEQLIAWAGPDGKVQFVLEPTAAYHELCTARLHAAGCIVSVVNAAHVRSLARGLSMLGKTDRIDCVALAQYGRLATPRAWQPAPEEIRTLQQLLLRLEAVEADLRREQNRKEQASVRDSCAAVIESIDQSIAFLKSQRLKLERCLRAHVAEHAQLQADFALLQTIPAVGKKTAYRMMAVLRANEFDSAKQLAAFLGLIPVEHQSGSSLRRPARLSKAGNPRLRAGLYMAAVVAKRINPDVRALYERLLGAGKSKMSALGACIRKLVHICYGVHRSGTAYISQQRGTT